MFHLLALVCQVHHPGSLEAADMVSECRVLSWKASLFATEELCNETGVVEAELLRQRFPYVEDYCMEVPPTP
jgi:hypothetical protein